eukprot:3349608-Rhodomonas_salina.1
MSELKSRWAAERVIDGPPCGREASQTCSAGVCPAGTQLGRRLACQPHPRRAPPLMAGTAGCSRRRVPAA